MCYDCRLYDILCFLSRLHSRFVKSPKTKLHRYEYLFLPQSWHCYLHDAVSEFKILKFEDDWMAKFTDLILEKLRNATEIAIMGKIRGRFLNVKARHTNSDKQVTSVYLSRISSNPEALAMIYDLYYDDFVLFNYRLRNQFLVR